MSIHQPIVLLAVGVVLLFLSTARASSNNRVVVNESDYWDVDTQKHIIRGTSLRFRKLNHPTNPYHTCYEVHCRNIWGDIQRRCPDDETNIIQICFPAVIVTGVPKCATSAMYSLLAKFPGAILMDEKENCPSERRRSHWGFLNSLPKMSDVGPNNIIIDGCINIEFNIKIRPLIREPLVHYIVMIRDYADMLWSSYNFWCKWGYDDNDTCDYSKWAIPGVHKRSPELFHDLVLADAQNNLSVVQPFHPPTERPCINAGGFFIEYLNNHLFLRKPSLKNTTIIVSSEELESYPMHVANRIANILSFDISGLDLKNFAKVRVNSQDFKGTDSTVSLDKYKPGRYNISNYRPMLDETRILLNKCWRDDCVAIAQLSGYEYSACANDPALTESKENNLDSISRSEVRDTMGNKQRVVINASSVHHIGRRRYASDVSMPWVDRTDSLIAGTSGRNHPNISATI